MCIICRFFKKSRKLHEEVKTETEEIEVEVSDSEKLKLKVKVKELEFIPSTVLYQVLNISYSDGSKFGWENKAKGVSDQHFSEFINWFSKTEEPTFVFKSNLNGLPHKTLLRRENILTWSQFFEERKE